VPGGGAKSAMFLYIDPIKQGLKPRNRHRQRGGINVFLYIDPIKQGLKLRASIWDAWIRTVFIHRSNKTRIETLLAVQCLFFLFLFLYIDPIKQGLKPI